MPLLLKLVAAVSEAFCVEKVVMGEIVFCLMRDLGYWHISSREGGYQAESVHQVSDLTCLTNNVCVATRG